MNTYPFKLTPLPYAYNAIEPYIDARTMELHHDKHLGTYVTNLNNALAPHTELHGKSLEWLLLNLDKLPSDIRTAVRNNGGGIYNHDMYFANLIPTNDAKGGNAPSAELLNAINRDFGSLDNMKSKFKNAGLAQFGSGWSWLMADTDGKLAIMQTPNQDTLLHTGLTPILNMDVWEHSYYLKYQNRRADYIDAFFNTINWARVSDLYSTQG